MKICWVKRVEFNNKFKMIEDFMLKTQSDIVHDAEHIYRVLRLALDIASYEENVDKDILTAACLLHDIGRERQITDPNISHSEAGSEMAVEWLTNNGFTQNFAKHVGDCIIAHSFRGRLSGSSAHSIEAKILYDADKLDAAGAVGIARTLAYRGLVNEPLYIKDENGRVSHDIGPSFLYEYKFKLSKIYDNFYTKRAEELAQTRKKAAEDFIAAFCDEII